MHHTELRLSADEHAALLALPPLDTSPSNLFSLRAAAVEGHQPHALA